METMFDETVTVRKAKERLQCEVVDGVMKIRCNYCEVWKDESSFNNSSNKNGSSDVIAKQSKCKVCQAKRDKATLSQHGVSACKI